MKAAQESVVALCNESGIAFADVSYRRLSGKEPPLKRHMGTLAVQAAAILSLASCSLVSDVTDELAARIYGRTWIAEEVAGQPVPGGLEPSLKVAPDGTGQIGRAHDCTTVTNAHLVCRPLREK